MGVYSHLLWVKAKLDKCVCICHKLFTYMYVTPISSRKGVATEGTRPMCIMKVCFVADAGPMCIMKVCFVADAEPMCIMGYVLLPMLDQCAL